MSTVDIIDLHKNFGSLEVLKGINLNINRGEKVVIIGPSGSGKSTLLKCIIRLINPDKGEIYIDDIRITDPKVDIISIRKRIGVVFQTFNLFYHLTVLKNITLPLIKVHKLSKGDAEKRAKEVLKEVGLLDKINSYPAELSGGQQQRVAIARALAIKPKVLLMDEPTSALDPELVDEVLRAIEKISRRNITMLIVTHEIDFAEDIADRIVFIDHGKIIEEGSPEDILYNPKRERTKEFLKRILRKRSYIMSNNHPTYVTS